MEAKEQAIAELKASGAQKPAEIKKLQQRLRDSVGGSGPADEVYRERDVTVVQAALENQIAQRAKTQLEQELIIKQRLLDECAKLKESLCEAEDKAAYMESNDYQSIVIEKGRPRIIEEFHQSSLGKIEVALACKAGSDFIVRQLLTEYHDFPGRLQYPPSIANHESLLTKLENAGAGYDVGEVEIEEEEGEEAELMASESSGGLNQGIGESLGGEKYVKVPQDLPSTPPPSTMLCCL